MMTNKRKRLTKKQTTLIRGLLNKIIDTNGGYGVVPPIDAEAVQTLLETTDGLTQLMGTRWQFVFRDGKTVWLDFVEAVVLIYNIRRLRQKLAKHQTELEEGEIEGIGYRLEFSLAVIMRPETVRRLFDAMEITDDPPPDPPIAAVIDNVVFRQTLVGPERRASLPDVPGLEQDLTDDQMRRITDVVKLVVTTRCTFKIYPPREIVEEPAVLRADDVVERLLHTKWWLAFNDGREELVSFPELIALTYQLVVVNAVVEEMQREMQSKGETNSTVDIDAGFNLWELLQPDMARSLLRRLCIEGAG
jgi:hypothetical protein